MKRFTLGIAAGISAVFVAVLATFGAVGAFWPDRLPPPAISRLAVIDEKLRFLRDHPDLKPQMLAVGSSITWRQLAGHEFERAGIKPFLNGGMVLLKTHHTRAMAEFFLDQYGSVGELLTLVSLPDFENCTGAPLMFGTGDAARYAFRGWPSAYFYLRYFDPYRYLRTARTLPEKRVPLSGEFYVDTYGSGPIQIAAGRGLRYAAIAPDPACTTALIELARGAAARDVAVTIVFPPVHPEYRRLYPDSIAALAEVVEAVRSAAAGDGATVVSMFADPRFTGDDFFDAFHLQWAAVDDLSRSIADAVILSRLSSGAALAR